MDWKNKVFKLFEECSVSGCKGSWREKDKSKKLYEKITFYAQSCDDDCDICDEYA